MNTQIVEMALVVAAFMGCGILWMWLQVRKFDKRYGHTHTRPPGE
ncbi:MAG: hypothetical protein ACRYGP_23360 [Janthinobacterium lividum]